MIANRTSTMVPSIRNPSTKSFTTSSTPIFLIAGTTRESYDVGLTLCWTKEAVNFCKRISQDYQVSCSQGAVYSQF